MNSRRINAEHGLYMLAFAVALGLRLYQLGANPLSDAEARAALQALGVAQGQHPAVAIQPLYTSLTALLMFVLGSGNLLARIIPALAGSLMVFTPLFFSRWLGKTSAVVLAFALAIDPVMVAASRQANTPILAVVFLIFACGFLLAEQKTLSGISAGLALLGGTGLWQGILILALAAFWGRVGKRTADEVSNPSAGRQKILTRDGTIALVCTFILTGTLFFMMPDGISAAGGSLMAFITGWYTPSGIGIGLLLVVLLGYELMPAALGLWGGISGLYERDELDAFLGRWLLVALVIQVAYPGRTALDLIWVTLPLWALASRQLLRFVNSSLEEDPLIFIGHTLLVTVLVVFAMLNVRGMLNPVQTGLDSRGYVLSMLGAVLLILVVTFLVAWGWSIRVGLFGFLSGLLICLLFFTLSASWHAGGMGIRPWAELLRSSSYPAETDLLLKTMGDVSEWGTGDRQLLEVTVVGVDSPALRWLLRNFSTVTFTQTLPTDAAPSMVVTTDKQTLAQSSATYRGQDFALWQEPAWMLMQPVEWLRWGLFHSLPSDRIQVILWARTDLFPDSQNGVTQSEPVPASLP